MSSPRPLGPLCLPCTPHSTLNRVRIYMTSQSLQCSSYLSWAASPLQKQDIWRPPSSLSPHPLPKLSFKNYRRQLVYPRALVLGTQADGTRISSSVDTEGSKHNQLKTARTFPPPNQVWGAALPAPSWNVDPDSTPS